MIGEVVHIDRDDSRVRTVVLRFPTREHSQSHNSSGSNGRQSSVSATATVLREVTVCELIGQGSSSHVYRAYANGYPRLALKIAHGNASRLRQELDVLSRVCTRGKLVLPRFEFGALCAADELLIVAMELCVPRTLHDLLLTTRLHDEGDMLFMAHQVAQAVASVHEEGCVHRDVKPQNLVFDLDGNLKLIDYGLSSTSLQPVAGDVVAGTLSFMSPEMAHNALYKQRRVSVGAAADVWSLGMVAFTIFTQCNPYPSNSSNNSGSDGNDVVAAAAGRVLDTDKENDNASKAAASAASSSSSSLGMNEQLLRRVAAGAWCWPTTCTRSPALRELVAALLIADAAQRPSIEAVLRMRVWTQRRRCPPAAVTAFLGVQSDDDALLLLSRDEAPLLRAVEQRSADLAASRTHSRARTPRSAPHDEHDTTRKEHQQQPPPPSSLSRAHTSKSRSRRRGSASQQRLSPPQSHPSSHRDGNDDDNKDDMAATTPTRSSVIEEKIRDSLRVVTQLDGDVGGEALVQVYDVRPDMAAAAAATRKRSRTARERQASSARSRSRHTAAVPPPTATTRTTTTTTMTAAAAVSSNSSRRAAASRAGSKAAVADDMYDNKNVDNSSNAVVGDVAGKHTSNSDDDNDAAVALTLVHSAHTSLCLLDDEADEEQHKDNDGDDDDKALQLLRDGKSSPDDAVATTTGVVADARTTASAAAPSRRRAASSSSGGVNKVATEAGGVVVDVEALTRPLRGSRPRATTPLHATTTTTTTATATEAAAVVCDAHNALQTTSRVTAADPLRSRSRQRGAGALASSSSSNNNNAPPRQQQQAKTQSRSRVTTAVATATTRTAIEADDAEAMAVAAELLARRSCVEAMLAVEHAELLASLCLVVEEDQERYHLTWLAGEQARSAAHPHHFHELFRVTNRKYQYGFVCDLCDYEFVPTGRGVLLGGGSSSSNIRGGVSGKKLHVFHCACGRDLCPECYDTYRRACTCVRCGVVHANSCALRDHVCAQLQQQQQQQQQHQQQQQQKAQPKQRQKAAVAAAAGSSTRSSNGGGRRSTTVAAAATRKTAASRGRGRGAAVATKSTTTTTKAATKAAAKRARGTAATARRTKRAATTATRTRRRTNASSLTTTTTSRDSSSSEDEDEDAPRLSIAAMHQKVTTTTTTAATTPPRTQKQQQRRQQGRGTTSTSAAPTPSSAAAAVLSSEPWRPFAQLQQSVAATAARPTPEERDVLLGGEWVRYFYHYPPSPLHASTAAAAAAATNEAEALVYHIQPGRLGAIFFDVKHVLHSAVFALLERQFFAVDSVNLDDDGDDHTRVTSLLRAKAHGVFGEAFALLEQAVAYDAMTQKQHRVPGTVSVYQAPRSAVSCRASPFVYVRWFRASDDGTLMAFMLSNGAMQVFVRNEYELRWLDERRKFRVHCNGVCEVVDEANFVLAGAIDHLLYHA